MLFQFQTNDVTFASEEQEYFEKRISGLEKFLGFEAGDEDSIKVDINISKNRHHAGERFECSANITSPHHGKFHAEVIAENIKKCADELHDKLQPQMKKFHEKHERGL